MDKSAVKATGASPQNSNGPSLHTSPLLDAAISENAPEESESNKSNPTRAPDFRGVRITAADYQLEEMIPSMFESLGEKVEIDLVNGENGDSKVAKSNLRV